MTGAATRSRWRELAAARESARRGRELLDEKREILQRELTRRAAARGKALEAAAAALAAARSAHREARIEMGSDAVDAAALAQSPAATAELGERRILGVSAPTVILRGRPWAVAWGPGGTSESLDRAAAAYAAALPLLAELAQAELVVRNLARALARANRRLNALEIIVLPELEREVRDVAGALEEDERDESFRRKRWFRARQQRRVRSPEDENDAAAS
jgi:V/A-type H+/Na+-transporting ATPase subunit D